MCCLNNGVSDQYGNRGRNGGYGVIMVCTETHVHGEIRKILVILGF